MVLTRSQSENLSKEKLIEELIYKYKLKLRR